MTGRQQGQSKYLFCLYKRKLWATNAYGLIRLWVCLLTGVEVRGSLQNAVPKAISVSNAATSGTFHSVLCRSTLPAGRGGHGTRSATDRLRSLFSGRANLLRAACLQQRLLG